MTCKTCGSFCDADEKEYRDCCACRGESYEDMCIPCLADCEDLDCELEDEE